MWTTIPREIARREAAAGMERAGRIRRWRDQAARLQVELHALYLAYRHPGVPWYAKAFAACVVGYAFSPVDLIPDFIPVLGHLDDLILVPLGIALAHRMVPPAILDECRERARERLNQNRPRNWVAAGIVMIAWLLLMALAIVVGVRVLQS